MMKRICGAMTLKGTPCQWDREKCIHHGPGERAPHGLQLVRSAPREAEQATANLREPTEPPEPPPPALAERDIRGLAWWLFEQVTGDLDTTKARVLTSILHLLESLGPGGTEQDERLGEVVHVAKLALGIQPADDAEWDWVLARYEQDAIDEFHRWPRLDGRELNMDGQDIQDG